MFKRITDCRTKFRIRFETELKNFVELLFVEVRIKKGDLNLNGIRSMCRLHVKNLSTDFGMVWI